MRAFLIEITINVVAAVRFVLRDDPATAVLACPASVRRNKALCVSSSGAG
jgi:hypothetical protein